MTGLFIFQIFISIAIKFQNRQVRSYIYSIIKELKFPPKRIKTQQMERNNNNKLINKFRNNQDISLGSKKESNSINIEKHNAKYENDKIINLTGKDESNEKSYRSSFLNGFKDKISYNEYFDKEEEPDYAESNDESFDEGIEGIRVHNMDKFKKKKKVNLVGEVKRQNMLDKIIKQEQEEKIIHYEYKEYDEKDLNELDFEKAIIHDKRNCCLIFWHTLRQKQMIINTFCSKDKLKPFSIKLLVLIFIFSCYFVINGFFFNEQYISKLFNSKRTNFLDVLMDSIESLIYTTIFGGLISFIIGFVFGTDKKIDSVMEANNKNKILLRGQLSKVYKLNNLILVIFIIFQFIIMAFFTM